MKIRIFHPVFNAFFAPRAHIPGGPPRSRRLPNFDLFPYVSYVFLFYFTLSELQIPVFEKPVRQPEDKDDREAQ